MIHFPPERPIEEIVRDAMAVLNRELGFADTVRFVTYLRPGTGDSVAEKHAREDAEDAAAEKFQSQPVAVPSDVPAAAG